MSDCMTCLYKNCDGYNDECCKCIRWKYSEVESTLLRELDDNYKNANSVFSYPANEIVVEKVKDYLKEYLPTYRLDGVWRKSLHPGDRGLYIVVAENKQGFTVWSCWNDSICSLNHGHYNLSKSSAYELVDELFYLA